MADAKTKPTNVSVESYLAARASDEQRAECVELMHLFKRIMHLPPVMWGPSIVGYGCYQYTYESGRTGQSCLTGFAIRGKEIVVYLVAASAAQSALLAKLGKHKMGKSCLYIKRLSDVDVAVLELLIADSVAELKRRYGDKHNVS